MEVTDDSIELSEWNDGARLELECAWKRTGGKDTDSSAVSCQKLRGHIKRDQMIGGQGYGVKDFFFLLGLNDNVKYI